jgi:hypothetical protein
MSKRSDPVLDLEIDPANDMGQTGTKPQFRNSRFETSGPKQR